MSSYQPDFRLDGYEAVNDHVADQFWGHIVIEQGSMTVLAEHHSDDAEHSFYVMHNGAVTWGIPGEPQLVALHLKRDPAARSYQFDHKMLPLPSMAQSWLIARGCPEEKILLPEGMGTAAADEATRVLEQRLRSDGDHFAYGVSYTDDASDPVQTTVMLRAMDEKAAMPYRVLLEVADTTTWTHTLREGGFQTFEAATEWWEAHWNGDEPPLPTASPATRHTTAVPGLPARPAPLRGPSR
ncbi:hypothetical protein [Streptomyces coelicoflavus]|nr:hypothetical protein [Streptomyces coelicoflavus]